MIKEAARHSAQRMLPEISKNGPIVVALGGNALAPEGSLGAISEQFEAARRTVVKLADLIEQGHRIIVTHGNGPQVGATLRRAEIAAETGEVYELPLHICVANTQAGMGYMICESLNTELRRRKIDKTATTIITTVEVDPDDPEFDEPTKPIGKFYNRATAETLKSAHQWKMVETDSGALRRLVPSPRPRRIIQAPLIKRLVEDGEILVVAGGGGIPIVFSADGGEHGVEAVIDKDLTSALLAHEIGAGTFIILTSVEKVALNFGKSDERRLDRMTTAEACGHMSAGQFPAGSMGPKIQGALDFLNRSPVSDPCVIITDLDHVEAALEGKTGTRITRD